MSMSRVTGAGSGASDSLQGTLTQARHAFNRGNGPGCWANDNNLAVLDRALRYSYPMLETSAVRYRIVNAAEASRHFDLAAARNCRDENAVQKAYVQARRDYGIHFRLLDEKRAWTEYRVSPITRDDKTLFSVHKVYKGQDISEVPVPRDGTLSYFDKERHIMSGDDVVRHLAPLVGQHVRWNAGHGWKNADIAAAVIATAVAVASIPFAIEAIHNAGESAKEQVMGALRSSLPTPTFPHQ